MATKKRQPGNELMRRLRRQQRQAALPCTPAGTKKAKDPWSTPRPTDAGGYTHEVAPQPAFGVTQPVQKADLTPRAPQMATGLEGLPTIGARRPAKPAWQPVDTTPAGPPRTNTPTLGHPPQPPRLDLPGTTVPGSRKPRIGDSKSGEGGRPGGAAKSEADRLLAGWKKAHPQPQYEGEEVQRTQALVDLLGENRSLYADSALAGILRDKPEAVAAVVEVVFRMKAKASPEKSYKASTTSFKAFRTLWAARTVSRRRNQTNPNSPWWNGKKSRWRSFGCGPTATCRPATAVSTPTGWPQCAERSC